VTSRGWCTRSAAQSLRADSFIAKLIDDHQPFAPPRTRVQSPSLLQCPGPRLPVRRLTHGQSRTVIHLIKQRVRSMDNRDYPRHVAGSRHADRLTARKRSTEATQDRPTTRPPRLRLACCHVRQSHRHQPGAPRPRRSRPRHLARPGARSAARQPRRWPHLVHPAARWVVRPLISGPRGPR
jgi:hypothetical protein